MILKWQLAGFVLYWMDMEKNKMVPKVSDIGEFGLIERIQKIIKESGSKPGLLMHGIGDDTAVFSPEPGYEILVTCDSMVEGHHYLREHMTPFEIGKRAMAMNISDIGAMGGKPLYALVTLGLTSFELVDNIEEIYRGFISELEPFGASIIGGNITKTDSSPFIDITLMGIAKKEFLVLRSGARPGDAIMVTGYTGQSSAGYWILSNKVPEWEKYKTLVDSYLRPQHRAREGHTLAMSGKITSMIDISDGLSSDLFHICDKSAVGAEIKEEDIPVSKSLETFSILNKKKVTDFILGASDDYELLFTCPPVNIRDVTSILSDFGCPVTRIGEITSPREGMALVTKDGKKRVLLKKGWDHFSK